MGKCGNFFFTGHRAEEDEGLLFMKIKFPVKFIVRWLNILPKLNQYESVCLFDKPHLKDHRYAYILCIEHNRLINIGNLYLLYIGIGSSLTQCPTHNTI